MLDEHDRQAALVQAGDGLGQLTRFEVIEAGKGLVQEQDPGFQGQGTGHLQALEHAQRQLGGRRLGRLGDADQGQQLERPLAFLAPAVLEEGGQRRGGLGPAGGQHHVLDHGHGREGPDQLLRQSKAGADP